MCCIKCKYTMNNPKKTGFNPYQLRLYYIQRENLIFKKSVCISNCYVLNMKYLGNKWMFTAIKMYYLLFFSLLR